MPDQQLLIVSHAPSENTQRLLNAVIRGTAHPDIESVTTRALSPFDCHAQDVLQASGIILGTTENFGYMSGALKDFFDRIYYPCLEHTEALPYALYIRAGNDGRGTRSAVERIVTGLRWKPIQPAIICRGAYQDSFDGQCEELGMQMAAGLSLGIY